MKILRSIADLKSVSGPLVLVAGTFDGLHLGHQALIRCAMDKAERIDGIPVVMTFDRHPACVTRPEIAPRLLTSNRTKMQLLERMGVPVVLLLEFTPELSSVSAEDFIRGFPASLHEICVGSQWSFGHRGAGNITLLKQLGEKLGFAVASIPPVEVEGKPISSTRIRRAVANGDFTEASACLGRSFLLVGRVVSGAGIGATIGFPTANIEIEGMQIPPDGVYAVRVHRCETILNAVANIGLRPTIDSQTPHRTLEVHLFDFSEVLTGQELGIEFIEYLRGEEKYPNLAALTEQIAKDCERARSLLIPTN
ncbi:MAG: riboflavin biosynthesis protein RibF [bacterium]